MANIFICSKPLQLMVSMMIASRKSDHVFVVEEFSGAREVSAHDELKKFFKDVLHFDNRFAAINFASKKSADALYIDSDMGVKTFISLKKFLLKNRGAVVNVYEEGVGTYRNDITANKVKKKLYAALGVGYCFGGSSLSSSVHVFKPDLYKINNPKFKDKVRKIEGSLDVWVNDNLRSLEKIFLGDYFFQKPGSNSVANLYLTDWSFDANTVLLLKEKRNVFFKPHPHIPEEVINKHKISLPNVAFLPSKAPAEVILVKILQNYSAVNVFHKGSSCMSYIKNPRIRDFNMLVENE